jgi:hypothetical protein
LSLYKSSFEEKILRGKIKPNVSAHVRVILTSLALSGYTPEIYPGINSQTWKYTPEIYPEISYVQGLDDPGHISVSYRG